MNTWNLILVWAALLIGTAYNFFGDSRYTLHWYVSSIVFAILYAVDRIVDELKKWNK